MISQIRAIFLGNIFIILLLSLTKCETIISCQSPLNGTTPFIKDIFIGRCYYFVSILHKTKCEITSLNSDCSLIYEKFATAVLNKEPCNVNLPDFDEFLKIVNHPLPNDTSLFWSGTYTPAHAISNLRQYWSLEDTFSGYLLNEIVFCSSSGSESFNKYCPYDCVTRNNPFWNAASVDFAKKASGQAKVVLNGTRSIGAISNSSTFLNYELPNLDPSKVDELMVYLLHSPGQNKYETCEAPVTLKYLKFLVEQKNIKYSCEDNPENIIFYMCFNDPLSKECQAIKYLITESNHSISMFKFHDSYLLILAFYLGIFFLNWS